MICLSLPYPSLTALPTTLFFTLLQPHYPFLLPLELQAHSCIRCFVFAVSYDKNAHPSDIHVIYFYMSF